MIQPKKRKRSEAQRKLQYAAKHRIKD